MKKFLIGLSAFVAVASVVTGSVVLVGAVNSSGIEIDNIFIPLNEHGQEIKIALISDIHYPFNKPKLEDIVSAIEECKPDVVFYAGDLIDALAKKEEIDKIDSFLKSVSEICNKQYAVLGNHETDNKNLSYFKQIVSKNGVILLENEVCTIEVSGKKFALMGLNDNDEPNDLSLEKIDSTLAKFLLAHRPELFEEYIAENKNTPDIVFAGHANGGLVRLFGKGVYSRNIGLFPKYTSGHYKKDGHHLIVSRGLGDGNGFRPRVFNSYHLPLIAVKI